MNLEILKSEIDNIKHKSPILKALVQEYKRTIILGNGGSNAIASHISVDYTKFLNTPTLTFSNTAMLTAYTNDYGQDQAYTKFIEHFYNPDTLVILISSSGNSPNIVNAAHYCVDNNIPLIILSGFDTNNKLNQTNAIFKYHVPHNSYGVVELAHEILLHSIVDN
jgi:D-sedoheptulose 7-phosphate isomerase